MSVTLLVLLKTFLFAIPITAVLILLFHWFYKWIDLDIELPGRLTGIAILMIVSFLFVYPRVNKHETKDKTVVRELYSPTNINKTYYQNDDIPDSFSFYRGKENVFLNKTGKTLVIYEVVYTPAGYNKQLNRQPEAKTIFPDEYFTWYTDRDWEEFYKMFVTPPRNQTYTTSKNSISKSLPSYVHFLDYYDSQSVKNEIRHLQISRYHKQ